MTTAVMDRPRVERLMERTMQSDCRVDDVNGEIRDVAFFKPISRNGRRYTPTAARKIKELAEGVSVNADHPVRDAPRVTRPISHRIGWLSRIRERNDGALIADLHLLTKHPAVPAILEMARRNPRLLGLSINCTGHTRRTGGETLVEDVSELISVDVVSNPATVDSLFEGRTREMAKAVPGPSRDARDFCLRITGASVPVTESRRHTSEPRPQRKAYSRSTSAEDFCRRITGQLPRAESEAMRENLAGQASSDARAFFESVTGRADTAAARRFCESFTTR